MTGHGSSPHDRSNAVTGRGLVAAALDGGLTVAVWSLSAGAQSFPEVGSIPRAPILAALFLAPAVVGAIGALSGARVLLVAAAIVGLVKAALAFSGVTLVFLLAVVLYLRAASATASPDRRPVDRVHPARWLALVALAVPVALFVVLQLGVFAVMLLVVLAGIAPAVVARRTAGEPRIGHRDAVLGATVVALLLGSFISVLAWTTTACWVARATPAGIVYEPMDPPPNDGLSLSPGDVGAGCSTGVPTTRGVAAAGIMVATAIAVSVVAARSTARAAG